MKPTTYKSKLLDCISIDRMYIYIVLFFATLYLPNAFILIEDLSLFTAYDPSGGKYVTAIESLFNAPYYSMHDGDNGNLYGWTYLAINFAILAPIKLLLAVLDIENNVAVYTTTRLVIFSVGLISAITFYAITKRLLANKIIAFCAVIMFIISPVDYTLFYLLQPDSTGLMFALLAMLMLIKFIAQPYKYKLYFGALGCLVLAVLSQQLFYLFSLPVLAIFFHYHCKNQQQKYISFIGSSDFLNLCGYSMLIVFAILLIIHPYTLLKPTIFISHLIGDSTVNHTPLLSTSLNDYIDVIDKYLLIKFVFFLTPIVLIVNLFGYWKNSDSESLFYVINALIFYLLFCIFTSGNIGENKYIPMVYPLLILNFLITIMSFKGHIKNITNRLRICSVAVFSMCIFLIINFSIPEVIPHLSKRLEYKGSDSYKVFMYLTAHILPSDKIAYDHFVTLPAHMKAQSCHYWQGCGTDYIDEYQPNYVIFNTKFIYLGKKDAQNERLKQYVRENTLQLIDTLKVDNIIISVYKK